MRKESVHGMTRRPWTDIVSNIGMTRPDIALIQRALLAYGYRIEETGENDPQTRFVVRAFQMHFRPSDHSGRIDQETSAILFALIEKYRPEAKFDASKQQSANQATPPRNHFLETA